MRILSGLIRLTGFMLLAGGIGLRLMAQGTTFEASLDRTSVSLGEQFTLSLTLSNAGTAGGKNIQLPDLGKFRIISGPNQSSSIQFINGAVSSTVAYTYILQPKEVGKFTIGPASIEAGGGVLKSSPLSIEVVKGSAQPRTQAPPPGDLAAQIGDNLLLRASVDRTRALQGEQVNLLFKIYVGRVSVLSYGIEKAPTYTGFWGEEVELPKNPELLTETINGKQYRAAVIRRIALFPTQHGLLEISPMEVQTTLQIQAPRSADPFDAFFRDAFGRTVNYSIKSDPVRVRVDPLPGRAPDDFRGAVGQFAMSAAVDKKTTRTNEPISLRITLSGTGNIKLLESPVVTLPPDFEQYSPKVSENISKQGEKVSGSKTFEYLLLPRYPGLKVIKPITFTYFDLSKREYVHLRSPQMEINVEQGAAAPPVLGGGGQEDVKLLSEDIRFIKVSRVSFNEKGEALYASGVFLVMLLFPLVGFVGVFVYSRQHQSAMADQVSYKHRRALRVAQKGLREAEYLLKEKGDGKGSPSSAQRLRFYAEVSRALWRYLGDKLNIPPASFSVEGALAELTHRSVQPDLQQSLKTLLETCDMARFAPTNVDQAAMQRVYDEAKRIIIELERTLKHA